MGQVIGHYHIDVKIGEGKFGIVYKARDVRLNRTVAVKVIKGHQIPDSTTWGRLLREARIASAMNHPNICTLYDIGEEQDIIYVVFEFVEGKTLSAILESGPLPIETVMNYGLQIAEAKAYIHAAGLLHRDLKSANIMVTSAGQIKIVDFGLAKLMEGERAGDGGSFSSSLQEIGWLTGTLPYMAPELLRGEAATTQSGVWSLGVVLFEMLTGELPFVGHSMFEVAMHIMTGEAKPLPMDFPTGLRGIVQRCLARDKDCRYYSAIEVLNDLRSELVAFKIKSILSNRPGPQGQGCMAGRWRSVLIWLAMLLLRR